LTETRDQIWVRFRKGFQRKIWALSLSDAAGEHFLMNGLTGRLEADWRTQKQRPGEAASLRNRFELFLQMAYFGIGFKYFHGVVLATQALCILGCRHRLTS
jgi:hypothetical protein